MKIFKKSQNGEITTLMVLLGIGIMAVGIIAGKKLVEIGTNFLPKAQETKSLVATGEAGPGTYEENYQGITYTPVNAWERAANNAASGNYFQRSNQVLSSFTFTVNGGDALDLYLYNSPFAGYAGIYVDGNSQEVIDLYTGNQPFFEKHSYNLTSGKHTIKISIRPDKNAGSLGYYVGLDKFVVRVNPTPTPTPTPTSTPTPTLTMTPTPTITSTPTPTTMPSTTPTPTASPIPPGSGTGLAGDYFDNSDLTNLKLTRTDATVNFNWAYGSPDPSIAVETFSVRWTGQVQPRYTQTYTFYTRTDDGVRLWVNNQLLIDVWVDQTLERSGTIALIAGQKYDIKMEYFENLGGASATLLWSSASQAKEIIPQSQLYPANTSPTSTPILTLTPTPTRTPTPTPAGHATVGLWHMDEASGNVIDSSGNGNTGIPTGTTVVAGKLGNARSFNGSSDYITLPSGFANFTSGFSVELWASPNSTGGYARFIDFGNGAANNNILFARVSTSSDLTFEVYNGGVSGGQVKAVGALTNNQWHYYAATENASGNVIIYKDGIQVTSGTTAVLQNITRAYNYIGKSNWPDALYAGSIDEVHISNYALSASEILANYQAQNGNITPTLTPSPTRTPTPSITSTPTPTPSSNTAVPVGYWAFDEGSGNTAADSSGNGNNGQLTGNNLWSNEGKQGKALSCNGTDTKVLASGNVNVFNWGTGSWSIALWVNSNDTAGTWQKRLIGRDLDANKGYWWLNWSNGKPELEFRDDAQNAGPSAKISTSIADGAWHHLAWVIDRSSHKVSSYVDGVQNNSQTESFTGSFPDANTEVSICSQYGGQYSFFLGKIDNVRLYNSALNPLQVVADMNSGLITPTPSPTGPAGNGEIPYSTEGLIGQWNFNETLGTTASNAAGSCGAACNGTLTNFANTGSQDAAVGTGWTANNKLWGAGSLMFDGSNDYVSTLLVPLSSTRTMSVEFWMYPTRVGNGGTNGSYSSSPFFSNDGTNGFWFEYRNSGSFELAAMVGGVYTQFPITTISSSMLNTWYYVAATITANGPVAVYINGQQLVNSTISNWTNEASMGAYIGTGRTDAFSQAAFNEYFQGVIDAVRIYSRVLSATEILANFHAQNVTPTPSPTVVVSETPVPSVTPTGTLVPTVTPTPTPPSGQEAYTIDIGTKAVLGINIGAGNTPQIKFTSKLAGAEGHPDLYFKLRAKDDLAFLNNPNAGPTCDSPGVGGVDLYIPMKSDNSGIYTPVTGINISAPAGAVVAPVSSDGWVSLTGLSGGKYYTLNLKGPKTRGTKMIEHVLLAGGQSASQSYDWTGNNLQLQPGDLPDPNNSNKQDCTVNSVDISLINSRLGKTDPDSLNIADVSYDGVVNANDIAQVVGTLSTKPDDDN